MAQRTPIKNIRAIKKILSNVLVEDLRNYIELQEIQYEFKYWKKLTSEFLNRIEYYSLEIKKLIPKSTINYRLLAFMISEFEFTSSPYDRLKYRIKEFYPQALSGANGLIAAMKLHDVNFYNIESIIITVKSDNIITEKIRDRKALVEAKEPDAVPRKPKITGIDVINEILRSVKANKSKFEQLAKSENNYMDPKYDFIKKTRLDMLFRRTFSRILYNYLKPHYPKYKQNKLFYIGGLLLYTFGLMPQPRRILDTHNAMKVFLIGNFKKAFNL